MSDCWSEYSRENSEIHLLDTNDYEYFSDLIENMMTQLIAIDDSEFSTFYKVFFPSLVIFLALPLIIGGLCYLQNKSRHVSSFKYGKTVKNK